MDDLTYIHWRNIDTYIPDPDIHDRILIFAGHPRRSSEEHNIYVAIPECGGWIDPINGVEYNDFKYWAPGNINIPNS